MKIRYLKDFGMKKAGEEGEAISITQGNYFIRVGVAEEVKETDYVEKLEIKAPKYKEKRENKTGNVPTALRAAKRKKK